MTEQSKSIQFPDISARAWEHAADRGVVVALSKLPGVDVAMRRLAAAWTERAARLMYVGSAIRVDSRQLPHLHRALADAAGVLDLQTMPQLFVVGGAAPAAWTVGVDEPFVVVTSGLVDLLDEDELRFVLGHELGHVLSGHAIYTAVLMQLLASPLAWIPLGPFGFGALLAALREWQRKAELSCDRAGLLVVQDPAVAMSAHMKLAGGRHPEGLDIAAFREQGEEYLAASGARDSALRALLVQPRTHPVAAVRAAELQRWIDGGEYERIIGGDYPKRSEDHRASVRDNIADLADYYRAGLPGFRNPLFSFAHAVAARGKLPCRLRLRLTTNRPVR